MIGPVFPSLRARARLTGGPSRTLESLLAERSSLSTTLAVDIAVDLCEQLAEAHASGRVHGRVGPSTVSLDCNGEEASDVTLSGLATERPVVVGAANATTVRAPEQLATDGVVDARTDVFGLGALLFTMLTGAAPFMADTPSTLNLAIVLDEPPSLAGVPDALAEIVEACLAKNPVLRPASVAILASGLAPFGTRGAEALERIRSHLAPESETALLLVAPRGTDADDTARREAVVEAMLLEVANDRSSLDISVDVEPSVRDVASIPGPPAPVETPKPPSIAPVSMSAAPPISRDVPTVVTRPRPQPRWRAAGLMTATACVAVGIVIGVTSTRVAHRAEAPRAAAAAARADTAATATGVATAESTTATPAATPTATSATPTDTAPPPSVPAASLADAPAAPAASGHGRTRAGAKAHAARGATGPSTSPAPAADPLVDAAKKTPEPQPKGSDDDLRRFLDDRR